MHVAQDTQDVKLGEAAVLHPAMLVNFVFSTDKHSILTDLNPGTVVGLCLPERCKTH